MGVTQPTIFPDVFKVFYNLLNNHIADPLNRGDQWIFSSNPYEDLEEGKVKFPVIIIEPADISWDKLTILKKWNNIKLIISAYSTQMSQADQLLTKIAYTINYFALNLKYEQGLDFILLSDTSTDYEYYGGTRSHVRSATFSMKNAWISGMAKRASLSSINSLYVIWARRRNLHTNLFIKKNHIIKTILSKSYLSKIRAKTLNSNAKIETNGHQKSINSISTIKLPSRFIISKAKIKQTNYHFIFSKAQIKAKLHLYHHLYSTSRIKLFKNSHYNHIYSRYVVKGKYQRHYSLISNIRIRGPFIRTKTIISSGRII
jgi:hypothetical protein